MPQFSLNLYVQLISNMNVVTAWRAGKYDYSIMGMVTAVRAGMYDCIVI